MKNNYYALFGVLFLLLSLGGAVYLVYQNADNRKQAAIGVKSAYDLKQEAAQIAKLEQKVQDAAQIAADKNQTGGSKAANDKLAAAQAVLDAAKKASGGVVGTDAGSCVKPNIWCAGCGGFCSDGSQICDAAITAKCGEMPQRGGNYVLKPSTGCSGTYYYECNCSTGSYCFDRGTGTNGEQCNPSTNDGLCAVAGITAPVVGGAPAGTTNTYYCPGQFIGEAGASQSCTTLPKAGFNINCYCGTIQIDTIGAGFKSQSMKCGCASNNVDVSTQTVTTATKIPTPTFVITTDTPAPTPTGTYIPTNTPTPTTPVITNTPTPIPTIAYLGCGYTPCDTTGKICNSGLTCVTANNSNQYCSLPQYVNTCKTNPGYAGCCTAPDTKITEGPSPTRIILPISGVEFPSQALTIIGGIATLLGFLILL